MTLGLVAAVGLSSWFAAIVGGATVSFVMIDMLAQRRRRLAPAGEPPPEKLIVDLRRRP